MIPLPGPEAADLERRLRAAASSAPSDHLDVALRAFSACAAARNSSTPVAIEAVSVGDDAVEILLDAAVVAPAGPFEVTAAGRAWTLAAGADAADVASRRSAPAPALVSVGRIWERELLVDLEAHPRTALVGDAPGAKALMSAMLLQLATSCWADDVRVVLVGDGPEGVEALERLHVAGSISEVLAELEAESRALTVSLREAGHTSTLAARLADGADGWIPTIVLVSDCSDPHLEALFSVATQQEGLAVVVAGDPALPVYRSITVASALVRVAPPGLEVAPLGLTEGDATALDRVLVLAASDEQGEEIVLDPAFDGPAAERDAVAPVALMSTRTRKPEVEVRVLGSPEIDGGKDPVDRKKSKELVVYLALHPDGVDESSLKSALWPEQVPSQGSFNQTVSRARLCLGRTEDGAHHLPHVADGRYRVGVSVGRRPTPRVGVCQSQGVVHRRGHG
jgi:hypothetical protein